MSTPTTRLLLAACLPDHATAIDDAAPKDLAAALDAAEDEARSKRAAALVIAEKYRDTPAVAAAAVTAARRLRAAAEACAKAQDELARKALKGAQ